MTVGFFSLSPKVIIVLRASFHSDHSHLTIITMKFTLSLAVLAASISGASAGAIELTKDTWDAETAGKAVFVKFL